MAVLGYCSITSKAQKEIDAIREGYRLSRLAKKKLQRVFVERGADRRKAKRCEPERRARDPRDMANAVNAQVIR